MSSQIISLDRAQVIEGFYETEEGYYALIVRPSGEHFILWVTHERSWNPWKDDDYVSRMPALFPANSGADTKLAEEVLKGIPGAYESWQVVSEAFDISLVDYVAESYEDEWDMAVAEAMEWQADEYLKALNLEEHDLEMDETWGYLHEGEWNEEPVEPPFTFRWKGESHGE